MKKFGYIVAAPSEFAIHQRLGTIKHQGRGISFLCLPIIDRYYRIGYGYTPGAGYGIYGGYGTGAKPLDQRLHS